MDKLLLPPEGRLRREHSSGTFFVPVRTRSTCSGDIATDSSSSSTFEDVEDQQSNSRRITLCKQVLLEATTKFNEAPFIDSPVLKSPACRNSGALLPLLNMLAAEQEPARMVRCLDTLSFLLLDRGNRRVCHELRALDVLLDILRRATDPQVLHSALEALCCLCKHDPKDKMALWQHPSKGALLSMLSSRHSSQTVVETLRTCRTLCFAVAVGGMGVGGTTGVVAAGGVTTTGGVACGDPAALLPSTGACCSTSEEECGGAAGGVVVAGCSGGGAQRPCGQRRGAAAKEHGEHPSHDQQPLQQPQPHQNPTRAHHSHHHHHHAGSGSQLLQLLEPGILTVASELLHPSADAEVLLKALKLLHHASAVVGCAVGSPGCCGCWHNAVFRIVPLLTHCGDVEVVDAALSVLVNLSQHDLFHNMFFASGCIPPLLHLLSHKRCHVSQSASCVLSALSEGGLSRDKLCQDTALLAMLRVLQTNHCVVVTLGVLYMLGRLAGYRAQVVRSLKGWGAVPLLMRLLATTQDEDAEEGCRQLLQALGVQPPSRPLLPHQQQQHLAVPAAAQAAQGSGDGAGKLSLHAAYSIAVFGGAVPPPGQMPIMGAASGNAALCRTISAAASVAAECAAEAQRQLKQHHQQQQQGQQQPEHQQQHQGEEVSGRGSEAGRPECGGRAGKAGVRPGATRLNHHSSFRFWEPYGVVSVSGAAAACGPMGQLATAMPPAAAY